MTLKERRFAMERVKNVHATDGELMMLIDRKLTDKTANKKGASIARKKDVLEYIELLQKDVAQACGVSRLSILQSYQDVYESAMKGDKRYDKDGKKLDRKPDRATAKSTLDSMVRMLGYEAPKEVKVDIDLSTWLVNAAHDTLDVDTIDVEALPQGREDD